jgi:hypothetical protein
VLQVSLLLQLVQQVLVQQLVDLRLRGYGLAYWQKHGWPVLLTLQLSALLFGQRALLRSWAPCC